MGRHVPRFRHFLQAGRKVAQRQGRAFDLNMLRQVLTLAVCDTHGAAKADGAYLIIGDGYGALSSIILEALPQSTVFAVNLVPVLEMDRLFVHMALGQTERASFVASRDADALLANRFHASFNVASMQEMEPQQIEKYFSLIRRTADYFYCCNRVSKTLPDGSVIEFAKYPWRQEDIFLIDELCPWHQSFYSFRPPFFRPFDGPIWHRLLAIPRRPGQ